MELEQEHPLSCLKRFLKVNPSRVRKQILTSFQQEMLLISLPRSCILGLKCDVKVFFHKSCKLASSEKDIIINYSSLHWPEPVQTYGQGGGTILVSESYLVCQVVLLSDGSQYYGGQVGGGHLGGGHDY